jgi:hypothetical protein
MEEWQIEDGHKSFTNAALFNSGIIVVLPITDPEIENAIWNDSGVLKISSGVIV